MFTGLIQARAQVAAVHTTAAGSRILINPGNWPHAPAVGDSIAVSGVCLTVAAIESAPDHRPIWAFDAIPETLAKTSLATLQPGDEVNLEHALTPTTLLGGHFVQGHVDGVGTVSHIQTGGDWRITIRPPQGLMKFMVPKGSICLHGVSLTLADLTPDTITVALIPVTLEKTTLATLQPGDQVNIEADILIKAVITTLERINAAKQ